LKKIKQQISSILTIFLLNSFLKSSVLYEKDIDFRKVGLSADQPSWTFLLINSWGAYTRVGLYASTYGTESGIK